MIKDKLSLYKRISLGTLFLLTITPLIVFNGILYPFIFSKVLFIRLILTIFIWGFLLYLIKRSYKVEIDRSHFKNKLFIGLIIYFGAMILSMFFGIDPYTSFWGNVERGEGLILILFLMVFLVGSLIMFREKHWLTFHKLIVLVGVLLAIDVIGQSIADIGIRPQGSFLGNPSFVSAYQLFALFSAYVVIAKEQFLKKFPKVFVYIPVALLAMSIIVNQTRGVLLGSVCGLIVALLLIRKEKGFYALKRYVDFRRAGSWILLALIVLAIFSGLIKTTSTWDDFPPLNEMADSFIKDRTIQTRIINYSISLDSINPANVGLKRFLFGWGGNNYQYAHNEFYNPQIQKYSSEWFDRAHNGFLDQLVMYGLIGLLAYLYLWWSLWKRLYRGWFNAGFSETKRGIAMAGIFLVVSYLVQISFLFDQISIYIPLIGFFAYSIYEFGSSEIKEREEINIKAFFWPILAIAGFLSWVLYFHTMVPYMQMRTFNRLYYARDYSVLSEKMDRITEPFNYVQYELRTRMLSAIPGLMDTQGKGTNLAHTIINLDYLSRDRAQAQSLVNLGYQYSYMGGLEGDEDLIKKGEDELRYALSLSPNRQGLYLHLAFNLILQGRYDEAVGLIPEAERIEPQGIDILEYYVSVVYPYDFNENYKTTKKLDELLFNSGEPTTPVKAARLRFGYANYVISMMQRGDTEGLGRVVERAILMERKLVEANQIQIMSGRLNEKEHGVESQEGKLLELLERMRAEG